MNDVVAHYKVLILIGYYDCKWIQLKYGRVDFLRDHLDYFHSFSMKDVQ